MTFNLNPRVLEQEPWRKEFIEILDEISRAMYFEADATSHFWDEGCPFFAKVKIIDLLRKEGYRIDVHEFSIAIKW